MIAGTGLPHPHSHDPHYQNPSSSRSRDRATPSQQARATASPRRQSSATSAAARYTSQTPPGSGDIAPGDTDAKGIQTNEVATYSGASRFPSPPPSSSPSATSSGGAQPQHVIPTDRPSATAPATSYSSASSTSTDATVTAFSAFNVRTMPSPDSDPGKPWTGPSESRSRFTLPDPDREGSPSPPQKTIHVRDLAHIQSLANAELLTATGPGILNDPPLQQMKYEISGMPIGDIIEMVAALLTKITTTNDLQHDALNRNVTHVKQAQAQTRNNEDGNIESNMSPLSSSVLAFHGKNVPAITILSYLSRIHKYCPTTYEVFLSLLVYFDRMTERVNDIVVKSEEARRLEAEAHQQKVQTEGGEAPAGKSDVDVAMRDDDSDETDSDLADDDDQGEGPRKRANSNAAPSSALATYFVVDSFNIHRLIIAGVTCASKFFSDVFYTNSRYAKVCASLLRICSIPMADSGVNRSEGFLLPS